MNHSQLHAIDLAIIGAYLIAMIVIGLVVVKKIKNTDDYYLGGLPSAHWCSWRPSAPPSLAAAV